MTKFISIVFLAIFFLELTDKAKAQNNMQANELLNRKEQAIVSIAAFTAKGDMPLLRSALNEGLK